MMGNEIVGTWGYRCLVNDRDLLTPFENLELDSGRLRLEFTEPGEIAGVLDLQDRSLTLRGQILSHAESRFRVEGFAGAQIAPEVLLYGWPVPAIAECCEGVETLVGSAAIQRKTKTGRRKAHLVASWYAVRDPLAFGRNDFHI